MNKPTLLVLAAGMGSRYGGLKQIDPVGPHGEIIIDYSIHDAIRAGFEKVVFVIRHDIAEDFMQAIGRRFSDKIEVVYAYQELSMLPEGYAAPADRTKPWGTGHAILAAKDVINEPFAMINADDFYSAEGYRLLFDHLSAVGGSPDSSLVAFTLRKTLSEHGSVARGVCKCTDDGFLKSVTEYLQIEKSNGAAVDTATGTDFTGDEPVSMNMWGFDASFFTVLETSFSAFLDKHLTTPKSEFLIPRVVDEEIAQRGARVKVLPTTETWFGVTYAADKPQVMKKIAHLIEQGTYPSPLWTSK